MFAYTSYIHYQYKDKRNKHVLQYVLIFKLLTIYVCRYSNRLVDYM